MSSVQLYGGAISVDPTALAAYSSRLRHVADELAGTVLSGLTRLGTDPSALAAIALDPVGAVDVARLTARCLALTGLVVAGSTGLAGLLQAAAAAYRGVDRLDRHLLPVVRAGQQLPAALFEATTDGYRLPFSFGPLPLVLPDPQRLVTADPELTDLTIAGLGAAVSPAPGLARPGTTATVAGLLAGAYPDGRPQLTARPDLPVGDGAGPPRGVADLIGALALRSRFDDGGGMIDVRTVTGPAGRHVIVDITGTTRWNFDPRQPTPQATSLGADLRGLANADSSLQRGVVLALRAAGVTADEPIMLVGHSLGGLVAAGLARDLTVGGRYRVTHLVTAGSPIGLAPVPAVISVLALENRGDPVPHLDGSDNPADPHWLTAVLDPGRPGGPGDWPRPAGAAGIAERHSADRYAANAADLDRCDDPALRRWRAEAAGFLSGTTVSTDVFQVRRSG